MSASPSSVAPGPALLPRNGEPARVRFELSLKSLLTVLGLIAVAWRLLRGLPVLLVLVTALMLIGALSPLVSWLERRQVRRNFAICLVFATGTMATGALLGVSALARAQSAPASGLADRIAFRFIAPGEISPPTA